ncbi:MAG TPA: MBL fold metallo-hydrolase [Fimbriimonas sp.]
MNGDGGIFDRGRLVCHCLLVETDNGLVLIDTGLGTRDIGDPEGGLPGPIWQAINQAVLVYEETALHQITELGYKPEDVVDIVLTHLDFDHAGGIADFPNARIHVNDLELAEALNPSKWISHERYSKAQFLHGPKWEPHPIEGETWFGFRSVKPLGSDDLLMVPLYGHSKGHCGVAVRNGGRWLLHAGDAIFYSSELDRDERRCPPGIRVYENVFQHDRVLRMENLERLRDLARNHEDRVRVLCSHDPFDFAKVAVSSQSHAFMS